jgi:hypothetical protein
MTDSMSRQNSRVGMRGECGIWSVCRVMSANVAAGWMAEAADTGYSQGLP